MRKILLLAFISSIFSACQSPEKWNEVIEIYPDFKELEFIMDKYDDDILVVNFWATSCPPCIKEMPHFKELEIAKIGKDVKILLVSLDKEKWLESRVIPFVEKYKIESEVCLLSDDNYSAWTAKIDKSWFGALPATLITNNGKSTFKFGSYEDYKSLHKDVMSVID